MDNNKQALNIAFFGSSIVSAYWNGAATYYRGILKTLHERGHRITFYEPDAYDRQKHRDIADPEYVRVVVYPPERDALDTVLEAARHADIIIKASGVGIFDAELAEATAGMKTSANKVLFWDVDAPATLDAVMNNKDEGFRKLIPRFDCVLTYGGGTPVTDAYASLGAKACVPIYNALDPETHHAVPASPRFASDLAFLGNRLPDREKRVEHFFLEVAEQMPEKRFVLGGSGWEDKRLPDNVNYLGHIYTHDHNAFNCSPHAVLNISRQSMADYGFSPATRVFEAAGAGACIITDYWDGIEQFLEPGKEILVARNSNDVAAYVRELTPAMTRRIGEEARKRVMREHTYRHRAAQLEMILLN